MPRPSRPRTSTWTLLDSGPTMHPLDVHTCAQHGWFGHVGVHEAGHAVAATLLGFDYLDVSIDPETSGVRFAAGWSAGWMRERPSDALVYLLAGSFAEDQVWGHYVADGWRRNMDIWHRGAGREDAEDSAAVESAALAARRMTLHNRAAILDVYRRFIDQVPHDEKWLQPLTKPATLGRDDVREAVAAQSEAAR